MEDAHRAAMKTEMELSLSLSRDMAQTLVDSVVIVRQSHDGLSAALKLFLPLISSLRERERLQRISTFIALTVQAWYRGHKVGAIIQD